MAGVFNVGVVGAGYVGLATGACLSHLGHRVVCVDRDEERIRGLEESVVTEWEEVRTLDLRRAASLMREPRVLVDGRNIMDPATAFEAGLLYRGFGRGR
jgi:UDPglucose 6-dehydrogenase